MTRPDSDWVLATLLDGVSTSNGRLELTVFCGGFAVSGTAVAEHAYLQIVGLSVAQEEIARQQEQDGRDIDKLREELDRDDLSLTERESLLSMVANRQRKFISMVDVTILGAGSSPIKAPAWRGRLSQISGWVLGSLDEPQ